MAWQQDLLRDSITRRLLATRLCRESSPGAFVGRCQQVQRICHEYLQGSSAQRPHLWAIESWFQFLQGHAGEIQDADRRAEIKQAFLDVAVHQVLALLIENRNLRGQSEVLLRTLSDDWEFQFSVNYFLRQDHYTAEPYESLVGQIDAFFSAEIGKQGES